jgi:hypothetical protein
LAKNVRSGKDVVVRDENNVAVRSEKNVEEDDMKESLNSNIYKKRFVVQR